MRKQDKLKNIQEANKKLLGENIPKDIKGRLDTLKTQYGVGEYNQCKINAKKVFSDFNIDIPYGGDFELFYSEYFNE